MRLFYCISFKSINRRQKKSRKWRLFLKIIFKYEKIDAWRCPTLTWGNPTLPSALFGFTSEFGMGSGGSQTLWSSGNLVNDCIVILSIRVLLRSWLLCWNKKINTHVQVYTALDFLFRHEFNLLATHYWVVSKLTLIIFRSSVTHNQYVGYMVKTHGQLVQVSFMLRSTSTPCLSTS